MRFPPGYHVHPDPDVLVLERADGSVVARFSRRGFAPEAVERAAWEDYCETEEPSLSRAPSGRRHPPLSPSRSLP